MIEQNARRTQEGKSCGNEEMHEMEVQADHSLLASASGFSTSCISSSCGTPTDPLTPFCPSVAAAVTAEASGMISACGAVGTAGAGAS